MAFWHTGTTKQYDVYLRRWEQFCPSKGINRLGASVENGIDFLVTFFTSGLGNSAINTARSAEMLVTLEAGYRPYAKTSRVYFL